MECCSGRCTADLLGFDRCLPIGGCRPSGPVLTSQGPVNLFGEICGDECDCCSELCEADENGAPRCKKHGDPTCGLPDQVKLHNGEICETDCQCISNLCAEPRPPDAGGQFPKRCLDALPSSGSGGGMCQNEGEPCVDPGECCNGLCLPSESMCGFECGGSGGAGGGDPCVPAGDTCTTTADCCDGHECIPDGMGGLTCALPPVN
jgi:hypothetical protein